MEINQLIVLVFMVPFFVGVIASTVTVQENQRAIVLRFGKFVSVLNPGINFIIPFLDFAKVVNLSVHIPDWQSLSKEEVNEKAKKLVLKDPSIDRKK